MSKPVFTIRSIRELRTVDFEIPGSVTTPAIFAEAVSEIEDQLSGPFVLLLNGRGPVWGYAMLIHAAHPTKAVATFDPRLGYVVRQTHDTQFHVGQVIDKPVEQPQ